jgi:hypothetical protein
MCRLRSFAVLSGRLQEHRRALEFSTKPYRVPRNVWNYLVYLPPARTVNKWAGVSERVGAVAEGTAQEGGRKDHALGKGRHNRDVVMISSTCESFDAVAAPGKNNILR